MGETFGVPAQSGKPASSQHPALINRSAGGMICGTTVPSALASNETYNEIRSVADKVPNRQLVERLRAARGDVQKIT